MSERLRASRANGSHEPARSYSSLASPDIKVPAVRAATQSSGQALDQRTQSQMSARFGHKFSDVRIHADSHAEELAGAMGANAFAVGEDIVFGPGKYQPGSRESDRLLAHELTHVVQQRRWGAGDVNRMSQRGDSSEREADSLADAVMAGQAVQVSAAPGAAIARDEHEGSAGGAAADNEPWWCRMVDRAVHSKFIDNSATKAGTDDALGFGLSLGVNKMNSIAEEAEKASKISDLNMDTFLSNHPDMETLGPGASPEARAAQLEGWNMNSVEEATAREAQGPMVPLSQTAESSEEALQTASRWSTPMKALAPLKFAGRVASPFAMISSMSEMVENFEKGNYADATSNAAGTTAGAVGTVDAVGAGLSFFGAEGAGAAVSTVADALNPVGAVAGSFAGGYEAGKEGLSLANRYAKKHDIFGGGRDSTETAADAGIALRDRLGGGTLATIAGGAEAIIGSWDTAAYSGIHAAGSGLKSAGSWIWDHTLGDSGPSDEEMATNQAQAQATMDEVMDQQMNAEEDEEMAGPSVSVAHDDAPPPPRSH